MFSTSTNSSIVKCLLKLVTSNNLHSHSTCTYSRYDCQFGQHQQVLHSGFYPSLVTRCGSFLECIFAQCYSSQQEPMLLQEEQLLMSAKKLLTSLSRRNLRNLSDVISSRGEKVGHCIPVLPLSNQKPNNVAPNSIVVLTWFLYHLLHINLNNEILPSSFYHLLRPLPWCTHHRHSPVDITNGRQLGSICLNPYHWSLLAFQGNI